jgi:hypothetical protein
VVSTSGVRPPSLPLHERHLQDLAGISCLHAHGT